MLNQMGGVLNYLRRYEDAVIVRTNEVATSLELNIIPNIRTALSNYSASLSALNNVAQALKIRQLTLALAQMLEDEKQTAYAYYYIMVSNSLLGRWSETEFAYKQFINNPPNKRFEINGQLVYVSTLILQDINQDEIKTLLDTCHKLNQDVQSTLNERRMLRLWGHLALREAEYSDAIQRYNEAVRIGNEQGVRDSGAWSGLARAYALSGNLPDALRIIEDGVDDHGHAAAVAYLANRDMKEATEAALKFYEWAWAQGEPYVRRWELEQAQKILAQLGVDEPQLPVWDESQYEPFAHEADIRALIEKLKVEVAQEIESSGEEIEQRRDSDDDETTDSNDTE